MHATTEAALRAIMRTDETIAREQEEAAIRAGKGTPTNPEPLDPILTVAETRRLCGGVDRHTLLTWERRGFITAVRTGKAARNVTGFVGASVRSFLAGKATGKAVA